MAVGGSEELDVGNSEDEVFWRGFFRTLKERSARDPQLAVTFPKIRPPMDAARAEVLAFTPVDGSTERSNAALASSAFIPRGGVVRLVGAVLNNLHDERRVSDRRYSSEGSMAKIKLSPRDIEVVAAIEADD